MSVTINHREEEILDPKMSIIDKIGTMARLCYKSEPKDGEDVTAVNKRVILRCIGEGHESVLEHGLVSLYLCPVVNEDMKNLYKKCTKEEVECKISFAQAWNFIRTDAMNKYTESFVDPDIQQKVNQRFGIKDDGTKRPQNVILANVRGWRQVIRERLHVSISNGNRLSFILTCKVLCELAKMEGGDILFGDLVTAVNANLLNSEFRKIILLEDLGEGEWSKLTDHPDQQPPDCLNHIINHFFKCNESVFADQASPCASISMILTTERAFTHQHVRHRKNVGYSQESQRYVNYEAKGGSSICITVDPSKAEKINLKVDPFTGEVSEDTEAYKIWNEAIEHAFESYNKLIDLGIPPESARGVLPNDCQTKIGVTWMRDASFINFVFWRLDGHAQFAIRSTVARIIYHACAMHHPFFDYMDQELVIRWLMRMQELNLISNKDALDVIIKERQEAFKKLMEIIKQSTMKKEEKKD